jgi:transposase
MTCIDVRAIDQTAIRGQNAIICGSLELSTTRWVVTMLLPGSEKMSRFNVSASDGGEELLRLLGRLRAKVEQQSGSLPGVVMIQEAGLDGFWVHRLLEAHGIESHVVDAGSVPVPRKRRRGKTDMIDGEALLRTLLAWRRGEPRVCSMVVPPSVEEEENRRLVRERETLVSERTQHGNRIKGLLKSQGITGYDPLRAKRRERLERLKTGQGQPLPERLKSQILRELDRLEVVMEQIAQIEADRDALLNALAATPNHPVAGLLRLRSLGHAFTSVLWFEGLYRPFANRRQLASLAGLAPTPWISGKIDREQGISKAGNRRLRTTMIELAWLWLRYQPGSALSCWFRDRVGDKRGRVRRLAIVALARKLLIALWRFATQGIIPEGAVLKAA